MNSQEESPWDARARKLGRGLASTMLLTAAALGGGLPFFGGNRSAHAVRHDPDRPKTASDLEYMRIAEERRQRRAAKRHNHKQT